MSLRARETPTRNKISYTRVLGSRWQLELVDETTDLIKDGDSVIAREIFAVIPSLGDNSIDDRPLHLLVRVELPDGRSFTRDRVGNRYALSWHADDGTRLKGLFTEIIEAEDYSFATYYLIGI
ncbi:MAG: hypothetical protein K2X27_00110 [Candidatus Obscuribacterales bacterium]|nr:hypothetical protein [Candidatus Obscuribacterales bacterium]